MKRIFVCSPYAGDVAHNVKKARELCRLAIFDGYAPFAPHLHYPGIVDGSIPEERATGIACGLAFMPRCDEVWAYVGNGISSGMKQELAWAEQLGLKVVSFAELGDEAMSCLQDTVARGKNKVPGESGKAMKP